MRVNNHLNSLITAFHDKKPSAKKIIHKDLQLIKAESKVCSQAKSFKEINKSQILFQTVSNKKNAQTVAEQVRNVILTRPLLAIKTQANLSNTKVYRLLK